MGLCCSSADTVDDHHTNHPLEDDEERHSISNSNLQNTTLESINISLHGKTNSNTVASVTSSLRNQHSVHSSSEEDHDPTSPKKNQKRKKKNRSKKSLTRKFSKSRQDELAASFENSPSNSPRTNYYYYEDIVNTAEMEHDSDDQHPSNHHVSLNHPTNGDLESLKISSLANSSYSSAVKYSSIMKGINPALGSLVSSNSTSSHGHHHHHVPSSPSLLTLSLQQQQIKQHMESMKRKQGASRRTLSEYQQPSHLEVTSSTSMLSFNEKKPVIDSKKQQISDFKKPSSSNLIVKLEESDESEEEDMDISDEDESLDSVQQFAKIQQETGTIRKHPQKEKSSTLPPNSLDLSSGTNSWFAIPNNLPKVNKVKTSKSNSKNQVDSDTTLLFKVVFIGDGEVGKSSCLSRFEGNTFSSSTRRTVGLEFTTRFIDHTAKTQANSLTAASPHMTSTSPQGSILFTNKHKIQLQFWDMGFSSYQEESLFREYLKDIQCIICVYSINSVSSFERLKQLWNTQVLPQLIKNHYLPHVKIVLLGNKTDLDCERSVDFIQGLEFARAMNRSILNAISSSPSPTTIPQKVANVFDDKSNNELKSFKNDLGALSNTNVAASFEDNSLTGNSISSVDDCDRIDAVKFFECSAKTGQNLETSIQTLAHDLDNYFSNYLL
ncbi:small GTPase [Naegleria gruberi]|uniref:Small GTPase n=1 Tax=Naegleria gruberi TaxID=5762 RepID=D2VJF7_NAEGR|nr:small GTPase [Naegleria gruberi]EFC43032.1 small GTPase [Naegleria gruberi]|eukprot:XP_002675776.1 small GTPase [Naegleria gruberi]